jgi:Uma2 family endonuclease
MSQASTRPLSVTEFLEWDDGTSRRHELVRGVPVAMATPVSDHAQISQNVTGIIERAVASRRPCRAVQQGGVAIAEGPPGDCFAPDVLLTCEPVAGQHLYAAPRLIVEVLSPGTRSFDKRHKVPAYAGLPSVAEIWLVDSRARWVQIYERLETGWHAGLPSIGQAIFPSRALGDTVALDDIYSLTTLA